MHAHRLEMFEKGKKAHYLVTKICKLLGEIKNCEIYKKVKKIKIVT